MTCRPKLSQVNKDFASTGGGPPHPTLNPMEELVAEILGKGNVSIQGIEGSPGLLHKTVHETSCSVELPVVEGEASGWDDEAGAAVVTVTDSSLTEAATDAPTSL
ncbi:uncharacterized protein LOC123505322 [Portunus trituberculatus]|uniref:uncharacterized protein LOC123505322 n=1 Tax=Portunus trituberculatus TaxID=210409 RepID=UPI001E1D0D6B|nr:uncharacterized protein LOC123505322 [Portunus trituberculatus]